MGRANERQQALACVQQMSFMIDDLRLFLNTHCDCEEALCALKYYIAAEREARKNYEKQYGPLTLKGIEGCDRYEWVCGAWPWEMEGC